MSVLNYFISTTLDHQVIAWLFILLKTLQCKVKLFIVNYWTVVGTKDTNWLSHRWLLFCSNVVQYLLMNYMLIINYQLNLPKSHSPVTSVTLLIFIHFWIIMMHKLWLMLSWCPVFTQTPSLWSFLQKSLQKRQYIQVSVARALPFTYRISVNLLVQIKSPQPSKY